MNRSTKYFSQNCNSDLQRFAAIFDYFTATDGLSTLWQLAEKVVEDEEIGHSAETVSDVLKFDVKQ